MAADLMEEGECDASKTSLGDGVGEFTPAGMQKYETIPFLMAF